ncbi:MAG: AbrB/MazE/SpoVT family DNA-binding domain-containing protein [Deltaproteobacteria bacterium]|nr:AbrB/MazE/SpoVT family DNA-binding domain-containing protein [Deltaproteobacteria bacterium]
MEKRLTACGNSLALTIDRPLLRLLGIGPNTKLRVSTDGKRLIVEPMDVVVNVSVVKSTMTNGVLTVREKIDAESMFRALMQVFHMGTKHFARVHPDGSTNVRDMVRFAGGLARNLDEITEREQAIIQRFWECFRALTQRCSWEESIEIALERVPM